MREKDKPIGYIGHPDNKVVKHAERPHIARRRLLSGRMVENTVGKTWQDFVSGEGNRVTGGAKADKDHPSRKHDLLGPDFIFTPPSDVQGPVPGQPRRRDRRSAERKAS